MNRINAGVPIVWNAFREVLICLLNPELVSLLFKASSSLNLTNFYRNVFITSNSYYTGLNYPHGFGHTDYQQVPPPAFGMYSTSHGTRSDTSTDFKHVSSPAFILHKLAGTRIRVCYGCSSAIWSDMINSSSSATRSGCSFQRKEIL